MYTELEKTQKNAEYLAKFDKPQQQLAADKVIIKTMEEFEKMAVGRTIKIMPCLDIQNGRVVKGVQFANMRDMEEFEKMAVDRTIKIMPCLDIQNGRVVKGVQFANMRDAGDPVECAEIYCNAGADEIAMLDITATVENRPTMINIIRKVAVAVKNAKIPITAGGGITNTADAAAVLEAGASKVSISSAAFQKPEIISEIVKNFGQNRVTIAIDAAANHKMKSGYEVLINGGITATGTDVAEWIKKVNEYGVGAILPTCKTTDGVKKGYALPLIKITRETVSKNTDVIASGGAGTLSHFKDAANTGASVLLAASVFHFNTINIQELKKYLHNNGINVAMY